MERANRFMHQWTGRNGYAEIPQVDSESPVMQMEEFSLSSGNDDDMIQKQQSVRKYATLGAFLLLGLLGFATLARVYGRQQLERESLSLSAACHSECTDPCAFWTNKDGQRLCCNWTYGPQSAVMCSLSVSPSGEGCYCVGEPLSMQAGEPGENSPDQSVTASPTAAPTAQPPWAQYLPDAYNPFKTTTHAPTVPLPQGAATLAPWRQYVPEGYQSYVTPSVSPTAAPKDSSPSGEESASGVGQSTEAETQASAEKVEPSSGDGTK